MGFVLLLALFVGMWMLLVRPQQQRLRAQRALVASLEVGDQVVTAGGIVGRITRLDDRDADIEVAPGIILTFLRTAVSRKLEPQGPDGQGDDVPKTADAANTASTADAANTATAADADAGSGANTANAQPNDEGSVGGTGTTSSAAPSGAAPGEDDTEEGTV